MKTDFVFVLVEMQNQVGLEERTIVTSDELLVLFLEKKIIHLIIEIFIYLKPDASTNVCNFDHSSTHHIQ